MGRHRVHYLRIFPVSVAKGVTLLPLPNSQILDLLNGVFKTRLLFLVTPYGVTMVWSTNIDLKRELCSRFCSITDITWTFSIPIALFSCEVISVL